MPFIGPWEIALIIIVVFIIFGPKRIPELAKGIGDAMRNFREAQDGRLTTTEVYETTGRTDRALAETARSSAAGAKGEVLNEASREMVSKGSRSGWGGKHG